MKENKRNYPVITITEKGEDFIESGNNWVYENEIISYSKEHENGDIVDVLSKKGKYLGTGFISDVSKIRVRIFSKNANDVFDYDFFKRRVIYAIDYRLTVLDKIDEGTMQVSGMANNFNILNDARLSGAIESLTQRVLPATEAVKKNKCMKLPSEYDIDAISIEIDRIENHHDRIYVLDLIYNKIEQINNFRDYCEITDQLPKYETKIKKMLSELETLRRAVLEKRNLNGGRYQVFVKYPHAYEG